MRNLCKKMTSSIRWAVDFDAWQPTEAQFALASSCLQLEERDRIGRFYFRRDVKSSLLGRLLLRKFLYTVSDISYNDILLERDGAGKPFCRQVPNWAFNVSHHGRYAVLAGEVDTDLLGVDVMTSHYGGGKSLSEFFRLMSRQFSSFEWKTIKSGQSEADQMLLFNRHWALKESYVKATGTGIVVDLQSLEFRMASMELHPGKYESGTKLFVNGEHKSWQFEETILNDHVIAVAFKNIQNRKESPPFSVLTVDEILSGAVPVLPADSKYVTNYFQKIECPY